MCWALGHVGATTAMDAEWDPAHWDLAVSYTVHIVYDTEYTLEYTLQCMYRVLSRNVLLGGEDGK